jgi:asparagine synthase (glutamine-hydrolysing)
MCGILGIVGRPRPESLDAVELMRHRGPDGDGRWTGARAGLAMRRLAIIDLETGDQPVLNERGDVVAVVNGELYNYRELRTELEAKGHSFRGVGDVEIVPHLYEEHGERFVERLRGMFALALWDEGRGRLLLARDRFGIKPLYLAELPHGLAFASELAPLLALGASAEPDPEAIADYLVLGYVPGERTGVAGVRKLAPAHVLVHEAGRTREEPYWRAEPVVVTSCNLLEETLSEAVRLHLRSDVPLAVLLSGGLDSSLIASLAAQEVDEPLRTFTVGFADSTYDERGPAREVARAIGSVHEELEVETRVAEDLPEIAARLEQPLADPAAIPLWYLCGAVASEVKVALAGDGGDEVFGGYSRYAWDPVAARLRALGPLGRLIPERGGRKSVVRRASKLLRNAAKPEASRYLSWFALMDGDARAHVFERLFADAPVQLSPRGRLQWVDLHSFVPDDLLLKADKLSMAWSLELRVPLLDHRVVEAGLALFDRQKVRGVRTKVAIRRLVEERLGASIARRPKQGFDPPVERWLEGELRDLAGDAIAGLDGLVDRRTTEQARPAQRYALTMLSLWRTALRERARELVRD